MSSNIVSITLAVVPKYSNTSSFSETLSDKNHRKLWQHVSALAAALNTLAVTQKHASETLDETLQLHTGGRLPWIIEINFQGLIQKESNHDLDSHQQPERQFTAEFATLDPSCRQPGLDTCLAAGGRPRDMNDQKRHTVLPNMAVVMM